MHQPSRIVVLLALAGAGCKSPVAPPIPPPSAPPVPDQHPAPATPPTAPAAPPRDELGYPWLDASHAAPRLDQRFATPAGFERVVASDGSFGAWLRGLPLRPPGTAVRSFRGDEVRAGDDPGVAAVVDLDVGARDLQQCADSIIRLDAEWRYARGEPARIDYPIGHGFTLAYERWAGGERPHVGDDDRVSWHRAAAPDRSHAALRAYLDVVFASAGTETLADTTRRVPRDQLRPGDFFVVGGHPGHAVLVLDVVADAAGHRRALLGQGYMPAQDFHVLAHDGDPWFALDGDRVETPFWQPFAWSALRRLP